MSYVSGGKPTPTKKELKEQFRIGAMRIYDNLSIGAVGYIRQGDAYYVVSRAVKSTKRIDKDQVLDLIVNTN